MIIFISYLSAFLVIVPLIAGIIFGSFSNKTISTIFALIIFSFLTEIINISFAYNSINNLFIQDIYTPVEFILFLLFYKHFFDSFYKTNFHYFVLFVFLLVAVFDTFFINDFLSINNFSDSVESVIFIIYSLLGFFFVMQRLMYDNLLNTAFFWINIAILIYFSGNLFLFSFSNYLQKNDAEAFYGIFVIHSITNIIYYILISIGFWKSVKK